MIIYSKRLKNCGRTECTRYIRRYRHIREVKKKKEKRKKLLDTSSSEKRFSTSKEFFN